LIKFEQDAVERNTSADKKSSPVRESAFYTPEALTPPMSAMNFHNYDEKGENLKAVGNVKMTTSSSQPDLHNKLEKMMSEINNNINRCSELLNESPL